MKVISYVIIILCAIYQAAQCLEFDESAWMDNIGRDKYFRDSEPAYVDTSYSNKIDFKLLQKTKTRAEPIRRHLSQFDNYTTKFIDFFWNKIKTVVQPSQTGKSHAPNEATKGLDIKLPSGIASFPPISEDFKLIYLGTKWCGAGDVAKSKIDVGYFYLTDSCCRAHDLCPKIIYAQQSEFGLKNSGKFTRLHCDCDNAFYKCLKSVNTLVSKQIGILYFNVFGAQCFNEDYPKKSCKEHSHNRCVRYELDDSKPKIYQWFDNKWY